MICSNQYWMVMFRQLVLRRQWRIGRRLSPLSKTIYGDAIPLSDEGAKVERSLSVFDDLVRPGSNNWRLWQPPDSC